MPMEIDKAPYAAAPGAGPHEGVPGSGRPRRAARYRARLGEALRWVGSVAARLLLRRVVTVCLEQDSVSIVVLRGRRLVAWGRVNLEEAWDTLAPGASPVDSEAVDMIRGLARELGLGRCKAVVGLPPQGLLGRRLKLPRIKKRYLERVVFSELDETLPFPQGSLDITWKAHRSEGGLEVWALAMPRQMSDRAVGLLKAAGVRPKAAYATAACLPLVFKEHHAILAHIGPSWASVVVSDGMPIVAHRVLLPEQGSAAGHRAQVVARAVAQAEAYHRETQEEQVNGLLPVVLTGSGPATEDVARLLADSMGQRVRLLEGPQTGPQHFPPSEYAANLALAMGHRSRDRAAARAPWIADLLPERHRPRAPWVRLVASLAALLLLGAGAILGTGFVDPVRARAAGLDEQVSSLERQDRQHRLALASAKVVGDKGALAAETTREIEGHLAGLDARMALLLARLGEITGRSSASEVQVSSLAQEGRNFSLSGTATGYGDVFQYARILASSGYFSSVQVLRVDESIAGASAAGQTEGGIVTFQLKASL